MYSAIPFHHSVSPPFLPIGSLLFLSFRDNNCNFRKCRGYVQSFKYLCRVHIFCRHTKVELHDTFLKGDFAHLISRPLSLFCLRHISNFAQHFFFQTFLFPDCFQRVREKIIKVRPRCFCLATIPVFFCCFSEGCSAFCPVAFYPVHGSVSIHRLERG